MRIRLLRHATVVVTLHGMRLLVDPMLSPAEGMEPVQQAASVRRIPLVELPIGLEALNHCLLTRAALAAALADAGVLGQAQIPDDGDVVPFVR